MSQRSIPTAPRTKKEADGLEREYVIRKINRMLIDWDGHEDVETVLCHLRRWVKAQRQRSKRPGGLGK